MTTVHQRIGLLIMTMTHWIWRRHPCHLQSFILWVQRCLFTLRLSSAMYLFITSRFQVIWMDCLLSLEWLSIMSTNQNMQSMFAGATSYRLRGLSGEWLMNILVSKSIQLCAVPAFLPIWTNGNFIHNIIILFVKLQWLRLKLSCNVGLVYRVGYANQSQTRPRYCQCKTWLIVLVWTKICQSLAPDTKG